MTGFIEWHWLAGDPEARCAWWLKRIPGPRAKDMREWAVVALQRSGGDEFIEILGADALQHPEHFEELHNSIRERGYERVLTTHKGRIRHYKA